MTARVIVVECCKECPHYSAFVTTASRGGWCKAIRRNNEHIPEPSTIPSWCPLEKKEGGE